MSAERHVTGQEGVYTENYRKLAKPVLLTLSDPKAYNIFGKKWH